MENEPLIQAGFTQAKKITQQFAKTFYLSSIFLPKEKRKAAYAIYALCRESDDAVDKDWDKQKKIQRLSEIEKKISLAYSNYVPDEPLLLAFKKTVAEYKIPPEYFQELIKGMYMDLTINSYQTFEDLYFYCYRVAGVVGLIMLRILGTQSKEAESYAIDLGIAMQLTNIIRDIKEDYLLHQRIYLPQAELKNFGLEGKELLAEKNKPEFKRLIKFQINRAKEYYQRAEKGIKLLETKMSRLVVKIMQEVYAAILDEIIKKDYDVSKGRIYVPNLKKAILVIKILMKGDWL